MRHKEIIILQHVENETAGTLLDYLKNHDLPFRVVPLYKDDFLPDLNIVRSLIVLGGPMNVYEEDKYPFLKKEDAYIKEAMRLRVPTLGICLGAQLLAKALGARVFKAKAPEIGWGTITLTPQSKDDPLFKDFKPPVLKVLQWHEDSFDLPTYAIHLASSKLVPHQVYVYAGIFYGFQFHIEVNREMITDWFKKKIELSMYLREFDEYQPKLQKIANNIYENFFNLSDKAALLSKWGLS